MEKNPYEKPASNVPDGLKALIRKWGCSLRNEPTYVILGTYLSAGRTPFMGILAGANNEFQAHLIAKEVRKTGGTCEIERTEYNPNGMTFSVADYMKDVKELREKRAAQLENKNKFTLVKKDTK